MANETVNFPDIISKRKTALYAQVAKIYGTVTNFGKETKREDFNHIRLYFYYCLVYY